MEEVVHDSPERGDWSRRSRSGLLISCASPGGELAYRRHFLVLQQPRAGFAEAGQRRAVPAFPPTARYCRQLPLQLGYPGLQRALARARSVFIADSA